MRPRLSSGLVAIVAVWISASSTAQQPQAPQGPRIGAPDRSRELAVWVSYGESDNLGEQSNPVRGSYDNLGVLFNINQESTRSSLGMATNLEFRHYSLDTFDDEPIGTIDLLAVVSPVPERFSWMFQEDYGQAVTDPFHPNTVGNRETFNVFSTGPQVEVPIGARTSLKLNSVWADRRYEDSTTLDSTDLDTEFGIFRQSRETTEFGLVARTTETEYDISVPSYNTEAAFLRYTRELASGDVLAEAGENTLEAADTEVDGPLARFQWNRTVASRSRITIAANREFTDSGSQYQLGVGRIDDEIVQQVLLTPNPVEQERVSFRYRLKLDRSAFSIQIASFSEAYQGDSSLDNDSRDLQISLQHSVTARLRLTMDLGSLERDFITVDQDDHDTYIDVQVFRDLGQHFELGGRVQRRKVTGSDPFMRDLYEIRLTYHPGTRISNTAAR